MQVLTVAGITTTAPLGAMTIGLCNSIIKMEEVAQRGETVRMQDLKASIK